jgi:hypothetical protein
MTWGVEAQVIERFGAAGIAAEHIAFARETYVFETDRTPTALLADFRQYYGPTMNAFAAAQANGKADETAARTAVAVRAREPRQRGRAPTSIPATFLKVTVGGFEWRLG